MELLDALSFIAVGITPGLIIGHRLGKAERRLDYERGRADGIWHVWSILAREHIRLAAASHSQPTRDTAPGGGSKPE